MGRTYIASFKYKFKRGDVCDYCGTIFGYDVEEFVYGNSKAGEIEAKQKAVQAGKTLGREEALAPCPNCGRRPSEAYAFAFKRSDIARQWATPPLLAWIGLALVFFLAMLWVSASGFDWLTLSFDEWANVWSPNWLGVLFFALVALVQAEFTLRLIGKHIQLFRSPAANLRAMKKAKAKGKKVKIKVETLGVCLKAGKGRTFKGRTFWALSATRILFGCAAICFYATFAAWIYGASYGERFFNAIADFYASAGLMSESARADVEAWMGAIWLTAGLATLLLVGGYAALVVWAGRDAVRFQGTRHFACGWERDWEGKRPLGTWNMNKLELDESRRTVFALRAADSLTEAGKAMLAIAEKEGEDLAS